MKKINEMMISAYLKGMSKLNAFKDNESGEVNMVAIVLIIIVVIALVAVYNVPLVKTQMKKIIVTAKTLYSHPKNVSKIYAALHTDLAW